MVLYFNSFKEVDIGIDMKNVNIISHPVVIDKLSILRDKETTDREFRRVLGDLSTLLAYECTRDLKLFDKEIETPVAKTHAQRISEEVILVSILRAGNGMLEAFMDMLPFARAGHIGIYRDKFINNTVEYYFKIPENSAGKRTIVLDPLIATGDTALASVDRLKQYGIEDISFCSVIISSESIQKIHSKHPDVKFYCVSVEKELTPEGYLIPGIGDAGNRLYKTK